MFVSATPSACYAPPPDRSLSTEGWALRSFVSDATAPPPGRDDAALSVLFGALERAEERDGTLIAADTFRRAFDLLQSVPAHVPLPRVVVESETELGLDWDLSSRRVVSLTVDNSSHVGYSMLIGDDAHYGRFRFVDGYPEVLAFLLDRLDPASRIATK